MKYLRKFETEAEKRAWQSSAEYAKPNVVLVGETNMVEYNVIQLGAYIQHIDGSLYTGDEWTAKGFSNDEANGVAVIDSATSFVIAKTLADEGLKFWGLPLSGTFEGVLETTDEEVAKKDYNGKANTEAIIAVQSAHAVKACAQYVFPNGKMGYMPALGEWAIISKTKGVYKLMNLIGGASLSSYFWSTTQYSTQKAWMYNWSTNGFLSKSRSDTCHARAFTTL